MLTARQNMDECIKGGNPDRVVNQYEAMQLLFHPFAASNNEGKRGDLEVVSKWGITWSWPENVPGHFPVHTPDKVVIKDIEHWKDYVKAPSLKFTDEEWGVFEDQYNAVDTTKSYKAAFVAPGLFEQCHHLGEISATLMNFYEYEDEMHELIKYLTEWEMELAEGICSHLHPDALFHHDDMGSQKSTFMSPAMWEEFFVEPYKEIYKYYHEHGCNLVIHHSDSYGATLVPSMIEMGIDVWQGCFASNDLPNLVPKYRDKITFMGGIENRLVDFEGWTPENNAKVAREFIEGCGLKGFIPCIAQGGPGSVFKGVYTSLCEEIDKYNTEKFGFTQEQLDAQRVLPWQDLF